MSLYNEVVPALWKNHPEFKEYAYPVSKRFVRRFPKSRGPNLARFWHWRDEFVSKHWDEPIHYKRWHKMTLREKIRCDFIRK